MRFQDFYHMMGNVVSGNRWGQSTPPPPSHPSASSLQYDGERGNWTHSCPEPLSVMDGATAKYQKSAQCPLTSACHCIKLWISFSLKKDKRITDWGNQMLCRKYPMMQINHSRFQTTEWDQQKRKYVHSWACFVPYLLLSDWILSGWGLISAAAPTARLIYFLLTALPVHGVTVTFMFLSRGKFPKGTGKIFITVDFPEVLEQFRFFFFHAAQLW